MPAKNRRQSCAKGLGVRTPGSLASSALVRHASLLGLVRSRSLPRNLTPRPGTGPQRGAACRAPGTAANGCARVRPRHASEDKWRWCGVVLPSHYQLAGLRPRHCDRSVVENGGQLIRAGSVLLRLCDSDVVGSERCCVLIWIVIVSWIDRRCADERWANMLASENGLLPRTHGGSGKSHSQLCKEKCATHQCKLARTSRSAQQWKLP